MDLSFSGDFDAICPLPATRYTIHDLGLQITTPWRPWIAHNEVRFTADFRTICTHTRIYSLKL